MALTLQEWTDKSVQQAKRYLPNADLTRLEVLANALYQEALQKLARSVAANPATRPLLLRAMTVAFVNGTGTLDDEALVQYADDASVIDTSNIGKRYSREKMFSSFVRVYDRRIGYFFIKEHTIQIIEPGTGYAQGSGLTGSRQVTMPRVPDVPPTATDEVDIDIELESDVVAVLADLIVGRASEEAKEAT